MGTSDIYRDKLEQASALLKQQDIDLWLLFVRETGTLNDPSLPLICDLSFTWETAVMISATGRHTVLAGLHDCATVRATGLFSEVVPYTDSMTAAFRELLAAYDPRRIALNYSPSDPSADGLTHGMWLLLGQMLAGTPYASRLESSETFLGRFRATKTPSELARVRAARRAAEEIWAATAAFIKPGQSEVEVAAFMHGELDRLRLWTSWERDFCPIVHAGSDSTTGHARPGERRITPGRLVNIDFGVLKDGYCTDQQRMWYCRTLGEKTVPAEVTRAFDTVVGAIQAAATVLRSGIRGYEVDAIARRFVTDAGYPEYQHALGHTVGRTTHDGGPLLGPRWDRYGTTPEGVIEAGQLYTLELGVDTPQGYCGLEEEVLVTDHGCEFLSAPQMELMFIE
jgi:Xaa-Pro aminopeptidase